MDWSWFPDLDLERVGGWITADLGRIVAIVVGLALLHWAARRFLGSVTTRAIERSARQSRLNPEVVLRRSQTLRSTLNWALSLLFVGSSRVDLQACKLEYSIVSPK